MSNFWGAVQKSPKSTPSIIKSAIFLSDARPYSFSRVTDAESEMCRFMAFSAGEADVGTLWWASQAEKCRFVAVIAGEAYEGQLW